MSLTHGMDIAGARELSGKIKAQAEAVNSVITAMNGLVNGSKSVWMGPDQVKFEGTEWPANKAKLEAAKQMLEATATQILSNVSEQETASK